MSICIRRRVSHLVRRCRRYVFDASYAFFLTQYSQGDTIDDDSDFDIIDYDSDSHLEPTFQDIGTSSRLHPTFLLIIVYF